MRLDVGPYFVWCVEARQVGKHFRIGPQLVQMLSGLSRHQRHGAAVAHIAHTGEPDQNMRMLKLSVWPLVSVKNESSNCLSLWKEQHTKVSV